MRHTTSGATLLPSIDEPIIEFAQGCDVPSAWAEIGWKPKRRAEDDGEREHKRRRLNEDMEQNQDAVAPQHTKKPLRSEPPRFDYSDIFHAFEKDLKSLKDIGVNHEKRTKMLDGSMEFELLSLYKDWVEETVQSERVSGGGSDLEFFTNLLSDLEIEENAIINDMCEPQIPDLVEIFKGCHTPYQDETDEMYRQRWIDVLLLQADDPYLWSPSTTQTRRLELFRESKGKWLVVLAPISDKCVLALKEHWLVDRILEARTKWEREELRRRLRTVHKTAELLKNRDQQKIFKRGLYHAGRGEQGFLKRDRVLEKKRREMDRWSKENGILPFDIMDKAALAHCFEETPDLLPVAIPEDCGVGNSLILCSW